MLKIRRKFEGQRRTRGKRLGDTDTGLDLHPTVIREVIAMGLGLRYFSHRAWQSEKGDWFPHTNNTS